MNKKLALSRLENLIKARNDEDSSNHRRILWMQHNTLERGNPIRIYEGEEFRLKQG